MYDDSSSQSLPVAMDSPHRFVRHAHHHHHRNQQNRRNDDGGAEHGKGEDVAKIYIDSITVYGKDVGAPPKQQLPLPPPASSSEAVAVIPLNSTASNPPVQEPLPTPTEYHKRERLVSQTEVKRQRRSPHGGGSEENLKECKFVKHTKMAPPPPPMQVPVATSAAAMPPPPMPPSQETHE